LGYAKNLHLGGKFDLPFRDSRRVIVDEIGAVTVVGVVGDVISEDGLEVEMEVEKGGRREERV